MTSRFIECFRSKVEIVSENKSYLKAVCPVCGDNSLKMNLTQGHAYYGAYRCWTNNCPNSEIREALNLNNLIKVADPFAPSKLFDKSTLFTSKALKTKPEYFDDNFEGTAFLKLRKYGSNATVSVKSGRLTYLKTIYRYSPYQRVMRIDSTGDSKKIYIQTWNPVDGWLAGSGDNVWPVYDYQAVLNNASNYMEGDSVVFVEGEKCAEYLRQKGCAAFTFMSSCWGNGNMDTSLMMFKYFFPFIKNICFIPDCDSAGELKEKYVRQGVNKARLGYTSLLLEDIFPEYNLKNSKKDVADLPWNPIRAGIINLIK